MKKDTDMKHRTPLGETYVDGKKTAHSGLDLGRKIGLLDPTTKPTTKNTYDTGK